MSGGTTRYGVEPAPRRSRVPLSLRVVAAFAVFSILWIVVTDWALHTYLEGHGVVGAIKGVFYVVAASSLIYVLVRLSLDAITAAQRTASRSERLFRTLIEEFPAPVWLKDRGGRYLVLNREARRWVTHSDGDPVGHTDEELFDERRAALHREGDRIAAERREVVRAEDVSDASRRPPAVFLTTRVPVLNEHGDLEAVGGMGIDISEQKDSERRLADLLAALGAAEIEERKRIADAVHDDTIQTMLAAAMRIDLAAGSAPPPLRDHLHGLRAEVDRAIERLRGLVFQLHPQGIEHAGLGAILEDHLRRLEQMWGLEGRFETEDNIALPTHLRILLFRIAQEALTNVVRHASASHVTVRLTCREGRVHLEVADDGKGPTSLEPQPGHLGVTLMRERAQLAGGDCTVTARPGGGTLVSVWVPLPGARGSEI